MKSLDLCDYVKFQTMAKDQKFVCQLEIDQYIGQYLGFTDISLSAKMADIIGLNTS